MSGVTVNTFNRRLARVTVSVTRPNAQGTPAQTTYVWEYPRRMRIKVQQGGAQVGNAHVTVYGLTMEAMNNIARLWLQSYTPQNTDTLKIEVYDYGSLQWLTRFFGTITWSAADASNMPHVGLVIEANASFALSNTTAPPYSNPGPVKLSDVVASLAQAAGFTVNYAAGAPDPYLSDVRLVGSLQDQLRALFGHFPALTYNIALQQVQVRAANAPLFSNPVTISVETGMQKSPIYSTSGLQVETIFDPRITPGTPLQVQSVFQYANQTQWVAAVLSDQLDVNYPGGMWNTSIAATQWSTSQ
jgi:hypothetical protein